MAALSGRVVADLMAVLSRLGCQEASGYVPDGHIQEPRYPRVYLVATPLGPKIPKLQAYHTSVMLDNVEHSFGPQGIMLAKGPQSHRLCSRGNQMKIVDMGCAKIDTRNWLSTMRSYFGKNTYDLLRKNCNSFTDAALSDLVGQRLDRRYRSAEQLAHSADRYAHLVRALSGGSYRPNPAAKRFSSIEVIAELKERHVAPSVAPSPSR
jgi:hypothetical protein